MVGVTRNGHCWWLVVSLLQVEFLLILIFLSLGLSYPLLTFWWFQLFLHHFWRVLTMFITCFHFIIKKRCRTAIRERTWAFHLASDKAFCF
jgi:CBS domain containing-hemolysin-like protein